MENMYRNYRWPPRTNRNVTLLQSDRSYYNIETQIKNRLKAAPQCLRNLDVEAVLEGHSGCVNCLEWSENGQLLASGSDDNYVILWNAFTRRSVMEFRTPHQGNIFSVKFLPHSGDALIATGAADRNCFVFDVNRIEDVSATPIWKCSCHKQRVKRLATSPDNPNMFWSAAEDGRIFQFDIREEHKCTHNEKICLIDLQTHMGPNAEAKCVAVNSRRPEQLAVGASDMYARVYDRRMIKLCRIGERSTGESELQNEDHLSRDCATYFCPGHLNHLNDSDEVMDRLFLSQRTITYLTFSPDGCELLVNMGSDQVYLYNVLDAEQSLYLTIPDFVKTYGNTENSNPPEQSNTSSRSSTAIASSKKSKLPKAAEDMKRSGNEFMEIENYYLAVDRYSECIHAFPNHPVFYLNRATAYMRRNWFGDMYAALRDCRQALILDPTYVKAHYRMARALFELGLIDEAKNCLDELKERFSNDANDKQIQLLSQDIQSRLFAVQNPYESRRETDSPTIDEWLSSKEKNWRSKAKDFSERFVGHCNTTTDIKEANYMGGDGRFVVAGSDEGNFYVWERPTCKIVNVYKGDTTIVNCVQPHPFTCMLATSGIDQEIRLWIPKFIIFDKENRVKYYESTVKSNQDRMQGDPYDFNAPGTVCRAS